MLRELRFELTPTTDDQETRIAGITPMTVHEQCPDFRLPSTRRNVPTILHESMKLDESEDKSAVRLLAQSRIINLDPNRTIAFRMSDFPDDIYNELRNVEILSTIKLFAIGPKTIDVVVHEDFQCIVHIKRSEFKDIPAPFLSRFQKYSFIQHFGRQYFYGLNENTLYSCLLSLIKYNENEQNYFINVHQRYVSPESIILKLPTFEDKIARWLCTNYFHQQEHFNIENFIQKLISNPSIDLQKKVIIFTRTSSYVIGLNEQSKHELF